MKKLGMLFVCLTILTGISAQNPQNEKIPLEAKSGFAAKFPGAQKIKWSIEKRGAYEVDFTINKIEQSALVDAKGNLIETEIEIKVSVLPQAVRASVEKDFASYKLDEITKATDAKGVVTYEMEAVMGKEKWTLEFDQNGKLLLKEPLKKGAEK